MSNQASFSDRQNDYKNGVRYTVGINVQVSTSYVRDSSKAIYKNKQCIALNSMLVEVR